MIEVVVVDENSKFTEEVVAGVQAAVDVRATAVATLADAEAKAGILKPGILVIGPSVDIEAAAGLAQKLSRVGDRVCILVTNALSTDLLQQALRAGVSDVVTDDLDEITAAVRRALDLISANTPGDGHAGDAREPGKVVTFFSTKGGVGKTVLATNTAVGLARQKDRRVILLDFDCQSGDVGVMLGLRPERTLANLMPSIDRLDADMLSGFLTDHSSGVRVLLAPSQPDVSQQMRGAELQKIFNTARQLADFVVIDTPASFGEATLPILDSSDCICLVTTLDVPSVKNTHIALQTLKLLNYPDAKIKLLLNRADSKVSLLPTEVERRLKHEISVEIPSDRAVPRSVNEGNPLIAENLRSPILHALQKIVDLSAAVRLSEPSTREDRKVRSDELQS